MEFNFYKNRYSFRPKLIPLVAFLLSLSILIGLSSWQFKRLVWKNNLIDIRVSRFESDTKPLENFRNPSDFEFQKVLIKGKLLNDFEFFMPALSKNGNNGFHILVPLMVSKNNAIIFDTGWVPLQKKERDERINNINNEETSFSAVIRLPGRKGYFQPENDPYKNYWFFVEPQLMEKQLEIKLEKNFYLEASQNGPNGFPLGNQTRIYLRNNHLQYAITWILIAFGLIGVFLSANVRKK